MDLLCVFWRLKPPPIFSGDPDSAHWILRLGRGCGDKLQIVETVERSVRRCSLDDADEGFGFFRWSGVDVAQQAIQAERAEADQVEPILNCLRWYAAHISSG